MNRKRPKQFIVRASETEFIEIQNKVKQSKLNQNEYVLKSILDENIIVVDGLVDAHKEFKRIGNNINQVAKAYNTILKSGIVAPGDLPSKEDFDNIRKELNLLWQSLNRITQKQL